MLAVWAGICDVLIVIGRNIKAWSWFHHIHGFGFICVWILSLVGTIGGFVATYDKYGT
jgi:hypothetical protein